MAKPEYLGGPSGGSSQRLRYCDMLCDFDGRLHVIINDRSRCGALQCYQRLSGQGTPVQSTGFESSSEAQTKKAMGSWRGEWNEWRQITLWFVTHSPSRGTNVSIHHNVNVGVGFGFGFGWIPVSWYEGAMGGEGLRWSTTMMQLGLRHTR